MKQNLKPLLIVAATALSVGAGLLYASSQKNAPQSAKAQAAKLGTEGFVPSAHPGVMVRSVPQENRTPKSEKTLILRQARRRAPNARFAARRPHRTSFSSGPIRQRRHRRQFAGKPLSAFNSTQGQKRQSCGGIGFS